METWWHRDVIGAGKLPLMLCFLAFVVTFLTTRGITRLIRAGKGPFRDNVTATGTHIHHAVPGLALLVVGAFLSVGTSETHGHAGHFWPSVAAVLIGVGVSLVLDEFALILHLSDVYWSDEGRLSVDVVSLVGACLGLELLGFSPLGVNSVGTTELAVRIGGVAVLVIHGLALFTCVLKGKFNLAAVGVFLPVLSWSGAVRLARPKSAWARHRYGPKRMARAQRRAAEFDRRWDPVLRIWQKVVAGEPLHETPQPPDTPQPPETLQQPAAPQQSETTQADAERQAEAGTSPAS